ncbi:MAG: hypothetical protein SGPRY_012004, partial [Prymnesium sp.]
ECSRVPQLGEMSEKKALASPRACARAYPAHVEKSIIFVWPWGGDPPPPAEDAAEGNCMTPRSLLSHIAPLAEGEGSHKTYTRDLPYGYDTLLENLVDASHVPFAHHGLQARPPSQISANLCPYYPIQIRNDLTTYYGTRDDAIPINVSESIHVSLPGFEYELQDRSGGRLRSGTASFHSPYLLSYDMDVLPKEDEEGGSVRPFRLNVVCLPISPGRSRAIIYGPGSAAPPASNTTEPPPTPQKKSLFSVLFKLLPTWLSHIFSSRFLDSDLAFLHFQEQMIQTRGRLDYFLPAPADRPISAMRKWLGEHTPSLGPLPPPITERSRLLDRWEQHVSQCVHCQKALEGIQTWRKRALISLMLSLLGSQWLVMRLVAALSVLLLGILKLVEDQFYWQDFKHYTNH